MDTFTAPFTALPLETSPARVVLREALAAGQPQFVQSPSLVRRHSAATAGGCL